MSKPIRATGPLRTWAGESPWRRFVAWLIRAGLTALLIFSIWLLVAQVIVPLYVDAMVNQMQNR